MKAVHLIHDRSCYWGHSGAWSVACGRRSQIVTRNRLEVTCCSCIDTRVGKKLMQEIIAGWKLIRKALV